MYIARERIKGRTHFFLRQSYSDGGVMKSRDLFYLGFNPRDYIVYPDNGNAYYIHEELCDSLLDIGVEPENDELERIFYPFLEPETQRVIDGFSRQGRSSRDKDRLRQKVARSENASFHIFDRRRMHYLRFMEMDQSRLERAPRKIFRDLLDKSRDEIEQYFMRKEQILKSREKKIYPYVIFNVADHFPGILARRFPQTISREQLDECFLEEVCRLNADKDFWADAFREDRLNQYLVRYVCWFFDYEFGETSHLEDMIWEWMARRSGQRPRPSGSRMKEEKALSVMGISRESLSGLTVKQLTQQYREKAQELHPDKGGDHEGFIKLKQAFEKLISMIKSGRKKP